MRPPAAADYSEDALVEQPAIKLLAQLGWQTVNAFAEFEHQGASPLGRETRAEVVLTARLRPALERLNPEAPAEAIGQTIEELTRDRSRTSPAAANRELYRLLKSGFRARVQDPDGDEQIETVRLIDWDHATNNDFLLCSQLWVTGEMHTRRADLVGFVNGLPLVFIELKAPPKRLETAYNDNLTDYKDTIPHLFWYNALIILSNGSHSRMGSLTAGWEHFAEWKKVGSESEAGRVSLETMLRATCEPARLLDLVESFSLFMEAPGGLIKLVAKNHQYLGVNNALAALDEIKQRQGRLGVFWHTQGSGKSVSMIFFAQKVLRKVPGNWTFVVVTDRRELDHQIYQAFAASGAVTEARAQAENSKHLRRLLGEDHRYVFTLIQKFRTPRGEPHPVLSERDDVIVITDEAHRSQYDTLAFNMRTALPNASFLAFTGTPLIAGEEKTREVFGDYVSIYDFRQSVADNATVPLYYENRIPELQLTNEHLNEDMERLLEDAELDDDQEKKLEREFAREYHLITRDDRLEAVAEDIVEHFTGRREQGVELQPIEQAEGFDRVRMMDDAVDAGNRADRQRARPGQENRPRIARHPQTREAHPRLAQAPKGAGTGARHHRNHARRRPAAGLHAGALPGEERPGLPARLRQLLRGRPEHLPGRGLRRRLRRVRRCRSPATAGSYLPLDTCRLDDCGKHLDWAKWSGSRVHPPRRAEACPCRRASDHDRR